MADSLPDLRQQRAALLRKITQLEDFRPGSITTTTGRCGNPHCHCHQPGHPGHGPNFRLTYKAQGKTVTRSLPTVAARQAAEREVEEYRKWQDLSRDFVGVNAQICERRTTEEPDLSAQEKKRPQPSSKKSARK